MKYQLVLQWPASAIRDYDAMIELEEVLIQRLSNSSKVDGHDAGSGEVNIFIFTNNPASTFNEVRSILGSRDHWANARVAYRECHGGTYTVLWPEGLDEFRVA